MRADLSLLPADVLVKTGDVDHADWNHKPVIGTIQKMRYRLVQSLLAGSKFNRLLEVGYGSGVFLPELSKRTKELFGIDIHRHSDKVSDILRQRGVDARLSTASMTGMPFDNDYFDCVVTVSSLEFVDDVRAASREVSRVLSPEGVFVVITPGRSAIVDLGLKVLTGEDANKDFGRRRELILPALKEMFRVEESLNRPRYVSGLVNLYTGLRLTHRN